MTVTFRAGDGRVQQWGRHLTMDEALRMQRRIRLLAGAGMVTIDDDRRD